jgi:hypothetical protein
MFARPDALLVLLAGITLLLAGRRLFWLFVGAVGFAVGFRLSLQLLGPDAEGMRWIVALAAGLLGVVLALAVQRGAVALAGFFVGGWTAAVILQISLSHPRPGALLVCAVAGVIAALLALRVFEGALIVLSSFGGAGIIVEALHIRPGLSGVALVGLTLVGVLVQTGVTARGRYREHERSARLMS